MTCMQKCVCLAAMAVVRNTEELARIGYFEWLETSTYDESWTDQDVEDWAETAWEMYVHWVESGNSSLSNMGLPDCVYDMECWNVVASE